MSCKASWDIFFCIIACLRSLRLLYVLLLCHARIYEWQRLARTYQRLHAAASSGEDTWRLKEWAWATFLCQYRDLILSRLKDIVSWTYLTFKHVDESTNKTTSQLLNQDDCMNYFLHWGILHRKVSKPFIKLFASSYHLHHALTEASI